MPEFVRDIPDAAVVSVVAPFYNEVDGAEAFVHEVRERLTEIGLAGKYEFLLVNDGSTDGTDRELDRLAAQEAESTRVFHLSRNFGHTAAVYAGLANTKGCFVILMDSDLQDDPAVFQLFLERWREGYDVVYAERSSRREVAPMRLLFWLFYRILNFMADTRIPADAGNYALMDGGVVRQLLDLPETAPYLPGLRAWVGFRQVGVPLPRRARYDAKTRAGILGKWRLALNAIFSFSYLPLVFFRVCGILALVASTFLTSYALYHKFITGLAVQTWASEFIVTLFFGGLNLFGLGVIGEYIGRIYTEVRDRPKYIVARQSGSHVGGVEPSNE